MICRLVATVSPIMSTGGSHVVMRCETHAFNVSGIYSEGTTLCPIGQIEQARDEAIKAIHAAAARPEQG